MYRLRAQPATYQPAYRANRACVPGVPAYRAAYCAPGSLLRTGRAGCHSGTYAVRVPASGRAVRTAQRVVHPPGDVT